jgi:copper chaperone CopZ
VSSGLSQLTGVKNVSVDFANQTVTCSVQSTDFDGKSALAKLAELGYGQSTMVQ